MSSCGLNVTILGFCVSGSTAAVNSWDAGSNPTLTNFLFNNLTCIMYIVKDKHWTFRYQSIDRL